MAPAGNRLHHGRLDFEIAARVEELAQRRKDLAAHLEHFAGLRVDDQIEITLAVADLDIGQAVPFFRHRHVAFCEELQARRPNRQLVGARAKQMSFDADDIAEIQQSKQLEIALLQRVLLDVHLNARAAIGQHQEIRLPEAANPQNAAAREGVDALFFELRPRFLAVRADEIGDRRRCARIGADRN